VSGHSVLIVVNGFIWWRPLLRNMGTLKEWNEVLVSHFLNRPAKQILFNVTQDVIAEIHSSEGFNKSCNDSIEDFLMALCNEKTGYGKKIDDIFDCKTTEKRKNGWPIKPENVFWNAYQLRTIFQSGNRKSVDPEEQYFKLPNYVPPWTSHLALTILAASMNVGYQPGNARYPMIADLFKQKMNISSEDAKQLNRRIQDEYVRKFFGKVSTYSYGYYWRAPRIVNYFYQGTEEWRSPWTTLYHWVELQSIYPGSFRKVSGWIMDPVTVHSRFRNEDRNAMLGALNSLSPGILPSNHALDQVIIQNKSNFRTANTKSISDAKLVALREYALALWENNQNEIRSYSPPWLTNPPSPTSDVPGVSEFQVMPYLYINLGEGDKTKRVQNFFPRLHYISGPLPKEGQIITIGEHKFQFYNSKSATSGIPLTLDGDLQLIRSDEVIVNSENEYVSRIYSFKASIDVYTASGSEVVLTQDQHGMYEWLPDDEVSQGFKIIKGMSYGYNDELLSGICGFNIGLQYDYYRPQKSRVKEIGRTKIKLDGGSKISGGTDRRYHFENPPHFVLTRGHPTDVEFLEIDPKEGKEGNHFLKEEPKQIQEKGKTIWKLSLKDDVFSDGSDSSIVKILYKLKTEEALSEASFTVVKGVDHWQLHPIAEINSNFEDSESVFDESVFTSPDLCMPITEEEKVEREEAAAEQEAERLRLEQEEEERLRLELEGKEILAREQEEARLAEERETLRQQEAARLAEEEPLAQKQADFARTQGLNPSVETNNQIQPEEKQNKSVPVNEVHSPPIANSKVNVRPGYGASKCNSCGIPLVNRGSTAFPCPNCDSSLGRCPRCRSNGVLYHCSGCDYIGP